jgi:hypothetical protein
MSCQIRIVGKRHCHKRRCKAALRCANGCNRPMRAEVAYAASPNISYATCLRSDCMPSLEEHFNRTAGRGLRAQTVADGDAR